MLGFDSIDVPNFFSSTPETFEVCKYIGIQIYSLISGKTGAETCNEGLFIWILYEEK